jgi:hypothetical protein
LTWQEELSGSLGTGASVQEALEKLPLLPLGPERLKLTAPLGLDLLPASVSSTVAVQTEPWLIATLPGEQLTLVWVVRLVTVSAKPVASALLAWRALPP